MQKWLSPSLLVVFLLLPALLGCPKSTPDAAPDAAAPASSAASADAGPASSAIAKNATKKSPGAKPTAPVISAKDRKKVLEALEEGRALSKKKDFKAAIAAFDRALAIDPTDSRVLAETGYAALQANDLARAEEANTKALANAHDTVLRAQILYNQGRVFEAKNDRPKAIASYDKSLALRDNPIVKQRKDSLSAAAAPPITVAIPCMAPAADVDAICHCLLADKSDYLIANGSSDASCEVEKDVPALGDPRLSIVKWTAGEMSEAAHLLAFKGDKGLQLVADLGHDYEPGAYGVHNTSETKGGEAKTVNGRSVVVLRSEQIDVDFNMAGLELCSQTQKWETVCKLAGAPSCVPIAVSTIGGCGPGVEPDPKDLDDDTKKAVASIKANAHTEHAETSWTIGDDGKLTVRLIPGGSSDLVMKSMLGSHPLF